MPNYEYQCTDCNHKFEIFQTYQDYGIRPLSCPKCKSSKIKRIIKPVRVARSEEDRFESLSDPEQLAGLEDDPQALGKMMRRMSRELGEDMGPEFDEVVDRLEKGQPPEEIEKDLPDLGSEGSGLDPSLDL
ncbi:MAG: zinc ribbon domain-containing protein [Anaerolineales bacterium]|nr:zinc ribbon domain-containing protein [Anaerolineales bacterium]